MNTRYYCEDVFAAQMYIFHVHSTILFRLEMSKSKSWFWAFGQFLSSATCGGEGEDIFPHTWFLIIIFYSNQNIRYEGVKLVITAVLKHIQTWYCTHWPIIIFVLFSADAFYLLTGSVMRR